MNHQTSSSKTVPIPAPLGGTQSTVVIPNRRATSPRFIGRTESRRHSRRALLIFLCLQLDKMAKMLRSCRVFAENHGTRCKLVFSKHPADRARRDPGDDFGRISSHGPSLDATHDGMSRPERGHQEYTPTLAAYSDILGFDASESQSG
ncbi:hypothetical protein PIIN_10114 [Serendipita indica DSM 11827]|uniref:Uncharacterized protein n=1 Tax=Serendipita indica (strain DSM 11827) TaxID=1109443 RepID=G4TXS1_SERID|nr:hypothetical protein PIIN_10114 [Serendipita indica DSM 11827]